MMRVLHVSDKSNNAGFIYYSRYIYVTVYFITSYIPEMS